MSVDQGQGTKEALGMVNDKIALFPTVKKTLHGRKKARYESIVIQWREARLTAASILGMESCNHCGPMAMEALIGFPDEAPKDRYREFQCEHVAQTGNVQMI